MKRLTFLAALMAAFFISPTFAENTVRTNAPLASVSYGLKTQETWPDIPKIKGTPALFGTVASGTGTATQYLGIVPVKLSANGEVAVTGNFAATTSITLPVASATANATDALPVGLFASDQSALQRLFTAIVMGDGVNGNNMLPIAQYVWNGTAWDRATSQTSASAATPSYVIGTGTMMDIDGNLKVNIASSQITLSSGNGVATNPTYIVATGAYAGTLASPSYANISNTSALQWGLVVNTQYSVATDTFLSLANAAAGVIPPYTIIARNTGTGKLFWSMGSAGFTATDTADFLAAGDSMGFYVATTTISDSLIASGSTGSCNVSVRK